MPKARRRFYSPFPLPSLSSIVSDEIPSPKKLPV